MSRLMSLAIVMVLAACGSTPQKDQFGTMTEEEARRMLSDVDLSLVQVEQYEIRPDRDARADLMRVPEQVASQARDLGVLLDFDHRIELDLDSFLADIDAGLAGNVMGYALQVRRNGQEEATRQRLWSKAPQDGSEFWDPEVSHHVASVSKFITAVALLHAMRENNVSLDDRIIDFLPGYWDVGQHVDMITFRQVLSHRSGFGGNGQGGVDYLRAREVVEAGVPLPQSGGGDWDFDYENVNFTLARILLTFISVDGIDRDATYLSLNITDNFWNFVTAKVYYNYVEQNVLQPAGVTGARLESRENDSLAYVRAEDFRLGWDSGDFFTRAGSVGWHFEIEELLRIMRAVFETGSILEPSDLDALKQDGLGVVDNDSLNALGVHYHGGSWTASSGANERSLFVTLPQDRFMAVFTNSEFSDLQAVVIGAFVDNVEIVPVLQP